jgi:signal transduction histidine kinase
VISANSTAALAFDDRKAAGEILASLKAEPYVEAACLYDARGRIFSKYPSSLSDSVFPAPGMRERYSFSLTGIEAFHHVMQNNTFLGTLYIRSDAQAVYGRLRLFSLIAAAIAALAFLLAYILSEELQRRISRSISSLAGTAKLISEAHDYSVRAVKVSDDEIGLLTEAFNNMLKEIERQNLQILSFSQQLEQKVEERTRELESSNRELESFSYSVSHDLTAPLRRVSVFIDQYLQAHAGSMNEEELLLFGKVLRNISGMKQLIRDILAFSHLGKRELARERVNMREMVTQVSDELVRAEEHRSIKLIVHDLPDAYADKVTIRQVWENLISNAIKYTSRRDPAIIEIGAEAAGSDVVYCIKDNGAGFDMRYYDRLFTAFQRLHDLHDFGGSGIGLAIVDRIIAKHGGGIWAEGEVNQGATFYFSLPGER